MSTLGACSLSAMREPKAAAAAAGVAAAGFVSAQPCSRGAAAQRLRAAAPSPSQLPTPAPSRRCCSPNKIIALNNSIILVKYSVMLYNETYGENTTHSPPQHRALQTRRACEPCDSIRFYYSKKMAKISRHRRAPHTVQRWRALHGADAAQRERRRG
mgnify:CR=1 FL=1